MKLRKSEQPPSPFQQNWSTSPGRLFATGRTAKSGTSPSQSWEEVPVPALHPRRVPVSFFFFFIYLNLLSIRTHFFAITLWALQSCRGNGCPSHPLSIFWPLEVQSYLEMYAKRTHCLCWLVPTVNLTVPGIIWEECLNEELLSLGCRVCVGGSSMGESLYY